LADKDGGLAGRSNLLVEENKKAVEGKIEPRGGNRFFRLAVSPEPELEAQAFLKIARCHSQGYNGRRSARVKREPLVEENRGP
jgi:hypothetical protein